MTADESEEDDGEYVQFLRGLSAETAVDRIIERTKGARCPFCDNDRWLVESKARTSGGLQAAPVFLMKDARTFIGPAPSIPTVLLSCSNCGFIRNHNISVVNDTDG